MKKPTIAPLRATIGFKLSAVIAFIPSYAFPTIFIVARNVPLVNRLDSNYSVMLSSAQIKSGSVSLNLA